MTIFDSQKEFKYNVPHSVQDLVHAAGLPCKTADRQSLETVRVFPILGTQTPLKLPENVYTIFRPLIQVFIIFKYVTNTVFTKFV